MQNSKVALAAATSDRNSRFSVAEESVKAFSSFFLLFS
jgi:hypothetical protein